MSQRRPKPRNIKLVIFDLDGTLVDAYPAIAESINYMLKKMGHPAQSVYLVKRSVGWGVDSLVRCFVPPEAADEALRIFRKHHDKRLHRNIKMLSGVKTLLPFLKQRGCLLAIASNRPAKFCHIILKTVGIDHYFDHVVCGDAVKRAKPYPDMIRRILAKARVRPVEAIFIGDMTVDVACGRAAGVFTAAVPTGSCSRAELKGAKPDAFVERISAVRIFFPAKNI